jgi:DNA-binding CsgD family transcriptional regulator
VRDIFGLEQGLSLNLLGPEVLKTIVGARKPPGIIIVTRHSEITYLNAPAWDLLTFLRREGTIPGNGLMPSVLSKLCEDIQARFDDKELGRYYPRLEDIRLVCTDQGAIVLRGMVLEGALESRQERPCTLILIECLTRRGFPNHMTKEKFGLSAREWAVTQNLVKGFTNKEIGTVLNITEQTVKAHINHIMHKMRCTTRTAIVSLVLRRDTD